MKASYLLFGVCICIAVGAVAGYAAPVSSFIEGPLTENLMQDVQVEVSSASSPPDGKYGALNMLDGDAGTRWASGAHPNRPVSITVTFAEPVTLDTLVLIETDMSRLYMHIKTLRVVFPDGEPVTEELQDKPGSHIIRFPERTTQTLTIELADAYSDKHYFGIQELLAFHDPDEEIKPMIPPRERWRNVDLTERGRDYHPCVYITPDDVERAKENIEKHEWAQSYFDQVIRSAESCVDHDAEWIREHCPPENACFAYGSTGCPICGARWGTWGGANCSFDRPGTVKCSNGHILPNDEYPDDGTGYVGEDGRKHFFVGSYNAWVVETYQKWCKYLSEAYLLTGEEKYAETCANLLDAIAEIYPTCTAGSWDYAGHSDPSKVSGRLNRPYYQTARVLVTLVDYYDKIYNSEVLDEPSFVEGMTRRENIEKNMLKNAAWYCYEKSLAGGLNNGFADYIRGSLSVGCLLGIEAYVDWAIDGPYGIYSLVMNNADRDGRYVETALCYSNHARRLYLTYADPLKNWRSEAYPEGLNLYNDPVFRSFYVLPTLEMDCCGHWPRYGDCGPDVRKNPPPENYFDATDYSFAEQIWAQTTDPQVKEDFAALVHFLAGDRLEQLRAGSRMKEWMLYHSGGIPEDGGDLPERLLRRITDTHVLGQKGMVFLRTPANPAQQACLVRYGPVLNHGHYDALNINYFGLGYEMTYDLGYSNGATHTQVGWAKTTAAHNTVMINETRQGTGAEDIKGGTMHFTVAMPGLQATDVDSDDIYRSKGCDLYRRFLALVGDGPNSYLLDIFNVRGGDRHDYILHALSDDISFDGLQMSERAEGSLAGPDVNWGERQMNDGFLSGVAHTPYWVAPPDNGLGFMMHPRRADGDTLWRATWQLPEESDHFRLTMLPQENTEIVNAWAPGIYPHYPRAEYVMARRQADTGDLRSTFVGLMEPYGPPMHTGGIRAQELVTSAETDEGVIKYISGHDIVLFQANEIGGAMDITLDLDESGDYYFVIEPYRSPAYGTAQFILDGQPLGEPYVGQAGAISSAEPLVFGPMELQAGEHTLTVKTVEGPGSHPWMGVASVDFATEDPRNGSEAAPVPVIQRAGRLEASDGSTALAVMLESGGIDRFFYAMDPGQYTADGDLQLDGRLAHIRTDVDQVTAAHLVGRRIAAPGFEMRLAKGQHTGTIRRIDYENNRIYTDADLPTDGRLKWQNITFSSPDYVRNTAYTINEIRREGDMSVIDLGTQRLVLGKAVLERDPPTETLLTSLVPHDYDRAKFGNARFFDGKRLMKPDGSVSTQIASTKYGQPMQIEVQSTEGLSQGDTLYYVDLKPGDEFVVNNWASLTVDPTGAISIAGTDDVTITRGDQELQWDWEPQ
ncbi:MAG: NADase-type glycan-binding domain-containing protein [Armatimonadota bacterium]